MFSKNIINKLSLVPKLLELDRWKNCAILLPHNTPWTKHSGIRTNSKNYIDFLSVHGNLIDVSGEEKATKPIIVDVFNLGNKFTPWNNFSKKTQEYILRLPFWLCRSMGESKISQHWS